MRALGTSVIGRRRTRCSSVQNVRINSPRSPLPAIVANVAIGGVVNIFRNRAISRSSPSEPGVVLRSPGDRPARKGRLELVIRRTHGDPAMRVIAAILLTCIGAVAHATDEDKMTFTLAPGPVFTGEALWNDYKDTNNRPIARAYILGVAHAADAIAADISGVTSKSCIPRVSTQPGGPDSVESVVARYLADNPGERQKSSAVVVLDALRKSCPCKRQSGP